MKKCISIALILILMAGPVSAHCGVCGVGEKKGSAAGEMMGKAKGAVDKMYTGLGLSAEQKEKIKVLQETKDKAIKAAKDEFSAGFKAVLTPEQLKIFEDMHKGHGHGAKGSH